MVVAQAVFDGRGLLRNGEQLLLTLIIPVLLLTGFSEASVLNLGHGSRVDFLTPGIIALAIMSTAFASQAIATGFERRYGVLKRLGATPLSRGGLVAARTVTMLAIEVLQLAVITAVAFGLGWQPHGGWGAALALLLFVLVGTAAFSGLGLLMAGTLRAEATLAAANLVYLMLLGLGGVMFPAVEIPRGHARRARTAADLRTVGRAASRASVRIRAAVARSGHSGCLGDHRSGARRAPVPVGLNRPIGLSDGEAEVRSQRRNGGWHPGR